MPIADCGFPPFFIVPGTAPPQIITAPQHLALKGPTIAVEIGFNPGLFHSDPAKVQEAIQATHASPPPPQLVDALIDTGAGESAIDVELAQQLQLPLVDHQEGSGIGGTEKFDVYLGHIRIVALGFLQYGRFLGVKLKAGQQPHSALLGRTVFQKMVMVYDGRDGTCRLAI
ncbi:MAG TPA: aspartyl protease family protein [Rhizomicrobium sp.]|nr:aspartyl protease family protein [Rhizomicrobium sp.]